MAGSLAGILTVLIGGVLALRGRGPHVLVVGGTVLAVTWGSLFLAARIQDRQVSAAKVVGTPLATAIERFVTDRGSPPERLMDLVPEYLESVPRCPLGLWGREYGYSVSGSEFNLWFSTSFGSGHFWDAGVHRWEHRD